MNDISKTKKQTDCVVSGVLSFVLILSKIAGIAPLKFKRRCDGWCVQVSWLYCVYGYIVMILFIIWPFVYYFGKGDEMSDERASWGAYTAVMRILIGTCHGIMIIAIVTVFHTGYSRMCSMIDCISEVTLINKIMNSYFASMPTNNAKLWTSVIILFIFGYLSAFLDYGYYMYDIILAGKVGFLSSSLIVGYVFGLVMHLYTIQFAMVIMLVVSTLLRVNNNLNMMLHEILNEASESAYLLERDVSINIDNQMDILNIIPRNVACVIDIVPPIITEGKHRKIHLLKKGSSNPDKIRYLAIIYCSLCDVVRRLNHSERSALLATLLFSFMYLITAPYTMFNVLFTSGSEIAATKCILNFMFFVFALTILGTAAEPCHRTHRQLFVTKRLIDKLLRYTKPKDTAIKNELKLFRQHIMLNPVSFRPCQLLTFNRMMLVTAVSIVVTNITVMINLH